MARDRREGLRLARSHAGRANREGLRLARSHAPPANREGLRLARSHAPPAKREGLRLACTHTGRAKREWLRPARSHPRTNRSASNTFVVRSRWYTTRPSLWAKMDSPLPDPCRLWSVASHRFIRSSFWAARTAASENAHFGQALPARALPTPTTLPPDSCFGVISRA